MLCDIFLQQLFLSLLWYTLYNIQKNKYRNFGGTLESYAEADADDSVINGKREWQGTWIHAGTGSSFIYYYFLFMTPLILSFRFHSSASQVHLFMVHLFFFSRLVVIASAIVLDHGITIRTRYVQFLLSSNVGLNYFHIYCFKYVTLCESHSKTLCLSLTYIIYTLSLFVFFTTHKVIMISFVSDFLRELGRNPRSAAEYFLNDILLNIEEI